LGWDDSTRNVHLVAERLQDIGIKALSIHGRTRVQMYKGFADWTLIGAIKDNPRIHIPIFGNGDIDSPEKAVEYKNKYGVDGIMIGRATIGNPWFFNQVKHYIKTGQAAPSASVAERVSISKTHLTKSVEWKGEHLGILEMRRHYANYLKSLPDIKPYRAKLVTYLKYDEIIACLNEIAEVYQHHTVSNHVELEEYISCV
jgi:tRNA-dihydrouridine synthase